MIRSYLVTILAVVTSTSATVFAVDPYTLWFQNAWSPGQGEIGYDTGDIWPEFIPHAIAVDHDANVHIVGEWVDYDSREGYPENKYGYYQVFDASNDYSASQPVIYSPANYQDPGETSYWDLAVDSNNNVYLTGQTNVGTGGPLLVQKLGGWATTHALTFPDLQSVPGAPGRKIAVEETTNGALIHVLTGNMGDSLINALGTFDDDDGSLENSIHATVFPADEEPPFEWNGTASTAFQDIAVRNLTSGTVGYISGRAWDNVREKFYRTDQSGQLLEDGLTNSGSIAINSEGEVFIGGRYPTSADLFKVGGGTPVTGLEVEDIKIDSFDSLYVLARNAGGSGVAGIKTFDSELASVWGQYYIPLSYESGFYALDDEGKIYTLYWNDGANTFTLSIYQKPVCYLGDTDGDLDVDFNDFLNQDNHFGESGPGSLGDADCDGDDDFDDFLAVYNFFGTNYNPGLTFVPEPTSVALLGLGAVTIMARRRSR